MALSTKESIVYRWLLNTLVGVGDFSITAENIYKAKQANAKQIDNDFVIFHVITGDNEQGYIRNRETIELEDGPGVESSIASPSEFTVSVSIFSSQGAAMHSLLRNSEKISSLLKVLSSRGASLIGWTTDSESGGKIGNRYEYKYVATYTFSHWEYVTEQTEEILKVSIDGTTSAGGESHVINWEVEKPSN